MQRDVRASVLAFGVGLRHHINMRANIQLRFAISGFPLRPDARAARVTPSGLGDGPVLIRDSCTRYHQLPRSLKIIRLVPLTVTVLPVPL
jgi:hypothetical protein